MFTYSDSVLDACDQEGNLSAGDAAALFQAHSSNFDEIYADNHGISWAALDARNGEALLAWLGY